MGAILLALTVILGLSAALSASDPQPRYPKSRQPLRER